MLQPGTQIAYVPFHAGENVNHADVELGFVTSVNVGRGIAFCRYWRKDRLGLRTGMNSEATPLDCIHIYDSVPQSQVDMLLARFAKERE